MNDTRECVSAATVEAVADMIVLDSWTSALTLSMFVFVAFSTIVLRGLHGLDRVDARSRLFVWYASTHFIQKPMAVLFAMVVSRWWFSDRRLSVVFYTIQWSVSYFFYVWNKSYARTALERLGMTEADLRPRRFYHLVAAEDAPGSTHTHAE